jgi:hypothetical protein
LSLNAENHVDNTLIQCAQQAHPMPSRADHYMAGADRVMDAPSECFASKEDLRRMNRKRPAVCDELNKPIDYKARTEGPNPAPEPLPDEARSMFNKVKDRFSDLALIM